MMRITVIFALLVLISSGCTRKSNNAEPILARVGSAELTFSEAKSVIPSHIFEKDSLVAYSKFRQDWIQKQIILQEAYRLQIQRKPLIQKRLQSLREDFLTKAAQDYIIGEMDAELTVTDEEARSYYQKNKDSFVLEERYVRYRHLITTSITNAQKARLDLLRGIEWEAVAENYATNPDKTIRESELFWPESSAGGDVRILNRYLKVIGISEISVIERVGEEYHFVQLLEERAKGDHPDLNWLIDQIKEWLILEKRRISFDTYVKNLYLQAQANNEIEEFDVVQQN